MKKICLILIFLIMLLAGKPSYAQNQFSDRLEIASVVLSNVYRIAKDTLEFELRLKRWDNCWTYWANGTFDFTFSDPGFIRNHSSSLAIEFISGSSGLNIGGIPGVNLPSDIYYTKQHVVNDRFSVVFGGPFLYNNSDVIPLSSKYSPSDTGLCLGLFKIYSINGDSLPGDLDWLLNTQEYYQACAYKSDLTRSIDSSTQKKYVQIEIHDDIEMDDGFSTRVLYDKKTDYMKVDGFHATYIDQGRVKIVWGTLQEVYNEGFVIKRRMNSDRNPAVDTTIADYRWAGYDKRCEGIIGNRHGVTRGGKGYLFEEDTVFERDVDYYYDLYCRRYADTLEYLASSTLSTPFALIKSARSYPNPFHSKTTIEFELMDGCYVDARAYDVTGREVQLFIEDGKTLDGSSGSYLTKGTHRFVFEANELASQMFYDIIINAVPPGGNPTNDKSRAVIKVNYIKDSSK